MVLRRLTSKRQAASPLLSAARPFTVSPSILSARASSSQSTTSTAAAPSAATSTQPGPVPSRRLNLPHDFGTSPILHHSSSSVSQDAALPREARASGTSRLNYFQAVNAAMRHALEVDKRVILFGEDVAFGGVFRCSMGLANDFGSNRVFNTPLTEQGIVGFGIGCAAEGMRPVAEIQFADYVFPAFDQIVNEAAKMRYRSGREGVPTAEEAGRDDKGRMTCAGLVIRMPCGGVGHGALYHSQSPESLFSHVPGMRVVMPRSPIQAKGMLLSAILRSDDPVIFLESKILYRAAVEQVPTEPYFLPLDKAEVVRPGETVTVVSYGTPMYSCAMAAAAVEKDHPGVSVELIDLRAIYPWDRPTVLESVRKTGRAVVVHESMVNAGVGAEVAATIQREAFLHMEAPVERVAGWSTHVGLVYEKFNLPDVTRIYDAIVRTVKY